jgi:lipopolysaccharide/colanic/teichoic acid biosynthesis glycosyltransferase
MTTSTVVEAVAPRATVSKNNSSPTHTPKSGVRAHNPVVAPVIGGGSAEAPFQSLPEYSEHSSKAEKPICFWKRSIDVCFILSSLPLVLPIMAVIVLWIKLVSRGPAIFRQERIGRNGRRFTLYKFRSMHVNADTSRHARHFNHLVESGSPMVKLDLLCDSRLIPLGCLLRAAGLDELPQLFNVLRGDMSLVGPRPCLPEEYRFFSRCQRVRFQVLPGLTGIWQTEGKGVSTFDEMNEMDARYVKTASPVLDLAIIFRTPWALLSQMHLAFQSRLARISARKESSSRFGAKPLDGYISQRLR